MSDQSERSLTPEQALDRLEVLHTTAADALRHALERFVRTGIPPAPEEREKFRYPELRVDWQPSGAIPFTWRSWAKFQAPGRYCTTVTQPAFFRRYLLEQLRPLVDEFGALIEVGPSTQEIPYPFVTDAGDEFIHRDLSVAELARFMDEKMGKGVIPCNDTPGFIGNRIGTAYAEPFFSHEVIGFGGVDQLV